MLYCKGDWAKSVKTVDSESVQLRVRKVGADRFIFYFQWFILLCYSLVKYLGEMLHLGPKRISSSQSQSVSYRIHQISSAQRNSYDLAANIYAVDGIQHVYVYLKPVRLLTGVVLYTYGSDLVVQKHTLQVVSISQRNKVERSGQC